MLSICNKKSVARHKKINKNKLFRKIFMLYILSSYYMKNSCYKIGYISGSRNEELNKKLIKRFNTSLIDTNIYYKKYFNSKTEMLNFEYKIMSLLSKYRIIRNNNTKSKCFNCSLEEISKAVENAKNFQGKN